MKAHLKKVLSYILVMVIILVVFPLPNAIAAEPTEPGITLGSASLSGGKFYYDNAWVFGQNIRTILISFSDSVKAGDAIVLPATPAGFTVSASSAGNNYTKRINLIEGIAASDVRAYIRSVGFTLASQTQTVQITVTTEDITQDTFYNKDTEHYYQFHPDTTSTWMQAYDAAKLKTYMGRTGYLATVTSLGEDTFINALSNGKTGWLGGTILTNTGISAGTLYYNGFNNDSVVSTGWYWACGPERGTIFYNINTLYPNHNNTTFINQRDSLNATYYNWTRGYDNEPTNNTEGFYLNSNYETCLSTLNVYGRTGKHGTAFSWNDIRYDSAGSDSYTANGYMVEYGDQLTGDSGSALSTFATDSGTLEKAYTATVNTRVNGALAAAPGNVELKQSGITVSTALSGGTGVYTAYAVNGTYDLFVNNVDTGIDIAINNGNSSVTVNYYTVSFSMTETGTALGSTISATAGGASITSGASVLSGKSVTITATGAGATSYTYAWSGPGTSGQTTAAITIPSLSGAVNASCAVTGTTTYEANVYTATDAVFGPAPGVVELKQSGVTKYTPSSTGIGRYTAYAVNGTYDIFINNEDTDQDIVVNGETVGVTVGYSTVSFAVADAGTASGSTISAVTRGSVPVTSGTVVLSSKGIQITATGAGADIYDYAWTGSGTKGEMGPVFQFLTIPGPLDVLCTVTGSDAPASCIAGVLNLINGVPAAAPGSVELWQGGAMVYTLTAPGPTGFYIVQADNGTYDVYINNEDTGKDIVAAGVDTGVQVDYYTVSFAAANAGAASGSSLSATAGGTPIASGTAVLPGKAVTITAQGAGAATYTYLWSGTGTSGETTAAITLPSLFGAVNALCTVTGTAAPTYAADIYTAVDGVYSTVPGTVELKQGGTTVYTVPASGTPGLYSVQAVNGNYDIFINSEDTGENIIIGGTAAGVQVDYYTVSFTAADAGTASGSTVLATAGGTPIASGTAVLPGKAVTITAQGAGAATYTYLWSGLGTSGETSASITIPTLNTPINALCTVTGTTAPVTGAAIVYTYQDGAPAAVSGNVQLKQGGTAMYTLSTDAAGVYTALTAYGTYDVYINNEDTGEAVTVSASSGTAEVYYYTVSFAVANAGTASGSTVSAIAGGSPIASGTAVLKGKAVSITATGAGTDNYTYLWSGLGTSSETASSLTISSLGGTVNALCTVTGAANVYAPGTLEEEAEDFTIVADGLFSQDARLYILPIPEGETNRAALEALQSGKQTAAAFEVYMEPANAFKPPLTLRFGLGERLNGKTVYILHRLLNGDVEHFTVTVANGEAVITVQELSPFLLSLDPPVTITAQLQNAVIVTGQTATFSVTASGAGPLSYQWQKKTGINASWEDIPGAVGAQYTTSQANLGNSGFQYRVIITDVYGRSVTSSAATLTVTQAPISPATGDSSQPLLNAVLMMLFTLGLILLLRKRKAA